MKKLSLLLVGMVLFAMSCVSNPEGEKAVTTDAQEITQEINGTAYTLHPQESTLRWVGRKVSATHHGTIDFRSGNIHVEGSKIAGGEFTVDMTSIVNEDQKGEWNEKLVGHLMSEDFFFIEEHPETTFHITDVKASENKDQVIVSGNLTIRGISKNITFLADVMEISENKVHMNADFNIERENWGITYAGMADDLIAKEINFKINIVAYS